MAACDATHPMSGLGGVTLSGHQNFMRNSLARFDSEPPVDFTKELPVSLASLGQAEEPIGRTTDQNGEPS
jgi:hypothetical protein